MEQRHLGRSGLRVSRLALGTMTWGSVTGIDDARAQLIAFVEAGGTLVDTAIGYGEQDGESILGGLLETAVAREDLVLMAKAGFADYEQNGYADTSRRALLDALDATLQRLNVDHVDVWLVQQYNERTPLEETL